MKSSFLYTDAERLPAPEVILTDWDDTLFNNEQFLIGALEVIIKEEPDILKREYRSFITEEKLDALVAEAVHETAGTSIASTLERVVEPNLDLEKIEPVLLDRYATIKEKTKDWLCRGALDFLNEVRARNIPIGIVSNKEGDRLRVEVGKAGVGDRFFSMLGVDDVPEKKSKPNPYPISLSLSKLGYKGARNRVWFLGDSLTDMKAAVAGGCFPVHVGRLASLDHETLRLVDQGKVMHCKGIETVGTILKGFKRL